MRLALRKVSLKPVKMQRWGGRKKLYLEYLLELEHDRRLSIEQNLAGRETKRSWFTNQPRNAAITIPWNVLRAVVSKGFYSHVLTTLAACISGDRVYAHALCTPATGIRLIVRPARSFLVVETDIVVGIK